MRKISQVDNNDLICEHMKTLVKARKAKASYTCVYKREEPYFWFFTIKPHKVGRYGIDLYIKLSQYDEFVVSITHPDDNIRFTDKRRYEGFSAMKPYQICEFELDAPISYPDNVADTERLGGWCAEVYRDAIERIDGFIHMVESEHGGLNQFLIDNAETDPLMAAFAHLYIDDYQAAEKWLQIAKESSLTFGRLFGSVNHDLRDVLMDYCKAKEIGIKWTRDMVLAGV